MRGTNERMGSKPQAQEKKSKLIQANKTLEMRDRDLTAAIRRCHIELAKKRKSLSEIEASKDAVEAAWEEYNQAIARYCMYAGGDSIGRKEIEEQPEEVRRALYEWKVLTDMMEQVVDKAEEYLESATKENGKDELYDDEDGGNELDAEMEVRLWVEQLSIMSKVNEMALEVSAANEMNANEVNDVNKVYEESTMNEDSDEVCDVKEGISKGKSLEIEAKVEVNEKSEEVVTAKPPDVPLRFDFTAKVQVEESGMKEEKNLKDDKKVEGKKSCHANWDPGELVDAKAKVEVSVVKEVKQIDDLKMREESRHASWDPGELVNAEAQMFNVKVEVTPSGDVNAKAFFDTMSLFNFVRLYTSEVLLLIARNAVRFVDINPLSSTSFAESFLPILSDYG